MSDLDKYWDVRPAKMVTNPSTNRARCSLNFVDVTKAVTTTPNQLLETYLLTNERTDQNKLQVSKCATVLISLS